MSTPESTTEHAPTLADIDQIAEAIENFVMDGDAEVDAIWQPYVDQLRTHRAALAAAPDLLNACRLALVRLDDGSEASRRIAGHVRAAIAKAEGRCA